MYEILFSNQFKRSYKKCLKRGCDKALFEEVVTLLAETGTLPQRYKAHKLTGQWKGFWECHIQPDWLLALAVGDGLMRFARLLATSS